MAETIASRGHTSEAASSQRDTKWVRNVGLTKLFEPPDGVAIADVVFVHGLQGHPWKTWRAKEAKSSKLFGFNKIPSTRVFWPHELLPDDVPNVRIFTYGYDSHISHGVAGPANHSNISQHGLTLLNAVLGQRQECRDRPLIFVAHSLGGLLVKQALLESSKQERDGRNHNLHKACRAVIFFGTPHRGSPDASLGLVIANIAKMVQFDINKSILRDLDPKSGSPTLGNLLEDFNSLLDHQKIQVYTFQESAGKTCFGPFTGKVVPEESSSFGFRKFEQRDMINRNHMEMCRIGSRDDDGYGKFLGALRGYLKDIEADKERMKQEQERMKQEQERMEEEHRQEHHQDLLRDLDFAERSAREQQLGNTDTDSSTFEWIWNVENSQQSFSKWLTDDQPVFWIQGKPGSGKSVLMDYLSKTDRVSQHLEDSFESQWIRIWFFFDFRADQGIANNFEGLLRSLLLQIIEVVPGMEPELRQFQSKTHVSGNVPGWNKKNLQEAFYKALANIPSRLYIFTDGLDEYSGNMHELLAFFQGLSDTSGIYGRVKICLASRPEPVIDLALKGHPGFRMQDQNFKSIKQYVSRTILVLRVAGKDEHRLEKLCADIADSAEGVFLWARFAISEVIGSYANGETSSELKRRLDELPSEMEGMYARVFSRMSTNDRDEARLAFQLVCFALQIYSYGIKNPTILQLKEAIDVTKNCTADSMHEDGVDSLERFRKRLRAKCGGLLEEIPTSKANKTSKDDTTDDDDPKGWRIKLIHRTVESYLKREGWLMGWQIGNEYFASPHALWLYICCKCVQSMWASSASRLRYTKSSIVTDNYRAPSSSHSLVDYAAINLFGHARCMEQQYQESSYGYLSLVTPSVWKYLQENHRRREGSDGHVDVDWNAVDKESSDQPWQITVEQGLALCCGDLVKGNLYKPLGNGQDISLALRLHRKYEDREWELDPHSIGQLINLLLESGSIVSQRNILECLYIGTASTLKLLLDTWPKGPIQLKRENLFLSKDSDDERVSYDVREDAYDGEAVGPLWELARSNQFQGEFESMLDLLLQRGERLDQSCGPGGTMLHALVISCCFGEIFRGLETLLGREVNVNVRMYWIGSFVTNVSIPFASFMSAENCGLFPCPRINLFYELQPRTKGNADFKLYEAPGPRGTPLQYAWRLFHSPKEFSGKRVKVKDLMSMLMDFGADTDWTEPDGAIVNEITIRAWCAMSFEQIKSQSKFDYAFCEAGWYNYNYPLYASQSEIDEYKRIWGPLEWWFH